MPMPVQGKRESGPFDFHSSSRPTSGQKAKPASIGRISKTLKEREGAECEKSEYKVTQQLKIRFKRELHYQET